MSLSDQTLELIARSGGAIARRDYPHLRNALQWLCRRNKLIAIFPGVFCRPEDRHDDSVRLRAVVLWHPDGVLMGTAAARASFRPDQRLDATVTMATRRKRIAPRGIRLVRWEVPDEFVYENRGAKYTAPALTALDLCLRDEGATIDEVLRRKLASLDQLWATLRATRFRLGNPRRREFLHDSRDLPWSPAERRAHQVMRQAGLLGWLSNLAINIGGSRVYLDLAFDEWKVVVEIDGFEFHAYHGTKESREQFERDRWKGTELAADGWIVLHITWLQLTRATDWVIRMVRKSLASRGWIPPTSRSASTHSILSGDRRRQHWDSVQV